jgi:protein TonB
MHLIYKPLFMEPDQIKEAHILDILFDGRNKEYGAYELRKSYNRRVVKALFAMGAAVGLLFLGGAVSGFGKGERARTIDISDDTLISVREREKPLVLPPPPSVVQPQVAQIRMTTIRIVPDNEVKPDEKPPENVDADKMKIGTMNKVGDGDVDVVGPPSNGVMSGVVEAPKEEGDDRFIPIEKEAEFPGGPLAWARFLNKTLHYPDEAINIGIQGTVMVQFVVDVDGNVSDVKAVSGPDEGGLKEEAMRVIKKSGKWVPALQNGRSVKAYRRQPVIFRQLNEN